MRAVRSLYDRSKNLFRITGSKSGLISGESWNPPGLPFVTDSVYNFYGQNI